MFSRLHARRRRASSSGTFAVLLSAIQQYLAQVNPESFHAGMGGSIIGPVAETSVAETTTAQGLQPMPRRRYEPQRLDYSADSAVYITLDIANQRSCAPAIVNSRVQLTLFATGSAAERIEEIRKLLDPIQFNLIAAHVTLCREDELKGLHTVILRQRLSVPEVSPLTLTFGASELFSTHGILLPCVAGEENFRTLRQLVLGSATARRQVPHITLAHPRNPKAAGNSLAAASSLGNVGGIRFESICLIQQDGTSPWRVLERFELPAAKDSDA